LKWFLKCIADQLDVDLVSTDTQLIACIIASLAFKFLFFLVTITLIVWGVGWLTLEIFCYMIAIVMIGAIYTQY
jgi:hypothetical protein